MCVHTCAQEQSYKKQYGFCFHMSFATWSSKEVCKNIKWIKREKKNQNPQNSFEDDFSDIKKEKK